MRHVQLQGANVHHGGMPRDETKGMNPDEGYKERIDRELIELLNEIRVALPGNQVLFAFLLILPFQGPFSEITDLERVVYAAALLTSALATALLIAPSVYHRLNFRRRNKEQMLFDSNRLLVTGTWLTGVGIASSVFLVIDVIFGQAVAIATTVVVLAVYGLLWFGLPILRRDRLDR